jgi:N-acetylglucosaminyldiphosphoundecaprenol N-acetyl-beta-D-mannosaminyltransferase
MYTRVSVLGVGVSAINIRQAVDAIDGWVQERRAVYVCVAAAHSIMDCWHDPVLRSVFNKAAMVTPDGMSLVWYLQLLGYRGVQRVYGPDLLTALCRRPAESGHRHFFYGGTDQVLADLVARLQGHNSSLQIAGAYAPPFRAMSNEEDRTAVEVINRSRPDIVWVGIGTPKQELWIAEHRNRLAAPVMIGVGAAFDFLSGHKPQAPQCLRRGGLEWLFRLASEPRRLWPRYREYPLFVALVLAQSLGLKRFPIAE